MNTFNIYVSLEGSGFIGVRQASAPDWLPESPEGFTEGLEDIRTMVEMLSKGNSDLIARISDKASELFLMSSQRKHLTQSLKSAERDHLNIVSEISLTGQIKTTPVPLSSELAFIKSPLPYRYFTGIFETPESTIH